MGIALSISNRTRRTPFTDRVEAFGPKGYSVYNHMLLPTVFESAEADYNHLKNHVQVWDVSCERQVEISGPDGEKLVQLMTPRDLAEMEIDQCYYIPIVNHDGRLINDPIAIKHTGKKWWLSIADSDLLLYATGLAIGFELDVNIEEPNVFPLAVQGPKAEDLTARIFGESVRDIKFFRHKSLKFHGHTYTVARSGWSKQGGYEIYVDNTAFGVELWDALFETGQDLNVRPGCPNLAERIEGGLLSYGNDMTREHTPFECGLKKFMSLSGAKKCVGAKALAEGFKHPPTRQIRGLKIDGTPVPACLDSWDIHSTNGIEIGKVSSATWSPDFNCNVAIAMINSTHWHPGTKVVVLSPDQGRCAKVTNLPMR